MKKLKKNIIITIIAILALFMIFAKPTYGLLNIDEDQSAVESCLLYTSANVQNYIKSYITMAI